MEVTDESAARKALELSQRSRRCNAEHVSGGGVGRLGNAVIVAVAGVDRRSGIELVRRELSDRRYDTIQVNRRKIVTNYRPDQLCRYGEQFTSG